MRRPSQHHRITNNNTHKPFHGKTTDGAHNTTTMNKINQLFDSPLEQRGTGTPSLPGKLLSLYFCAGCPELNMTADVILTLQRRGISMIEVGIPFSDPLADGPVVQSAGTVALHNGMTLNLLFDQLEAIKQQVTIPLVLMGYLNVVMHLASRRSSNDAWRAA